MTNTDHCYELTQLERFLRAELSRTEEQNIRRHIEDCSACQHRLEDTVGGHRWWTDVRSLLKDMDAPGTNLQSSAGDPVLDSEIHKHTGPHFLTWLGPTDDPSKLGRVGSYEVTGVIGQGGTGVVLKAFDQRLNRYVALKVLLPTLANNSAARRRFERESRAIAAITHEHVVPVFAVHEFNGLPYIVMHYVAGSSLQQRLDKTGNLQVTEAVRIAAQVSQALAAAHSQGLVHRDIKPANILLENSVERVLVTDFGLARVVDEVTTESGVIAGTPAYMSPEQCLGESVDHRSDLFSLGSVLYVMCTGRPPFRSQTVMGVLRKVCEVEPRPVRELNPDVPYWLDALIRRLLEKRQDMRFQSAAEVGEILQGELAHLQNPSGVAQPPRHWDEQAKYSPARSWIGRHLFQILGTAGVVALVACAALFSEINSPSTDDSSKTASQVVATEQRDSGMPDEKPAAEVRQLDTFSGVEVSGHVDLTIHRGPKQHVAIKGEAALMSHLATKVIRRGERDKRLVITFADSRPRTSKRVTVNITVPRLNAVTAGNTSVVAMPDVNEKSLNVLLKDAAKFQAKGVSDQLAITLENSSSADLSSLSAKSVTVLATGRSSLSLGNPSSLMVTANEKSMVVYESTPGQLSVTSNGDSQVKRREVTKGEQQ